MLLQGIQPTENPLKIWAQSNGRINSYRPFEPVLWLWRWHPPTDVVGVHLRFDATRRKTAYGNYSKNLGVIQSYGNLQPVLWSWLWDVPKDVVGMQ
jgi:hypothetical protein